MKKSICAIAMACLISAPAFSQKDELKTLKRIYEKDEANAKDVIEYKAAVEKAKTYLAGASEADKMAIQYYDAFAPMVELDVLMAKPENQQNPAVAMRLFTPENIHKIAVAFADMRDYEKKSGKQVFTKDIDDAVMTFAPSLFDVAVALSKQKQYKQSSAIFYDLYLMDKKNQDNLYNAANLAVSAEDYDTALKYYEELKALKYTGEKTTYYATNIATGQETPFHTKADRDKMIELRQYDKPRQEQGTSKRGEIYRNIALILVQKGKTEEAKAAFADAIAENPNDTDLLIGEANLYLNLKDDATYKQKISKVLEKKPNDPNLIYNIGVVTMNANQDAEAETYFKKVIEIDPNYVNAYLNLASVKLKADDKLVTEMNKITGTSEKENKKYEALKKEREALFKTVLPYLEKAYALDASNEAVRDNLMSVYNFLEMKDKYKELKAKKEAGQ
jgi:tetratricopeptide (TPR) repeat protein